MLVVVIIGGDGSGWSCDKSSFGSVNDIGVLMVAKVVVMTHDWRLVVLAAKMVVDVTGGSTSSIGYCIGISDVVAVVEVGGGLVAAVIGVMMALVVVMDFLQHQYTKLLT